MKVLLLVLFALAVVSSADLPVEKTGTFTNFSYKEYLENEANDEC